jgi:hypothetical protein
VIVKLIAAELMVLLDRINLAYKLTVKLHSYIFKPIKNRLSNNIKLLIFILFLIQSEANATMFIVTNLSDGLKQELKDKNIWKDNCPVPLERLRIVKFSYYDFEDVSHDDGEITVMDAVSKHVLTVFKELYKLKFPLSKASGIEHYNGRDEASMADNNTSSFNCREITGGGLPSIHSYGLAIDINPIQNPYIAPDKDQSKTGTQGSIKVLPAAGVDYLNRTNIRPGMSETRGVREALKKNGFKEWGGAWDNRIDWQHFQPSRAIAQLLAVMSYHDAAILFEMHIKEDKLLNLIDPQANKFIPLYQTNPAQFMKFLKDHPDTLAMEPVKAYSLMNKNIN